MDEFKFIAAFMAILVVLGFVVEFVNSLLERKKTRLFHQKEFDKWKKSVSNDIWFLREKLQELDGLCDFDRSAFLGEEGKETVELIIEKLDELRYCVERMADNARTHEQFNMATDAANVHAALRSAMRHYSRENVLLRHSQ